MIDFEWPTWDELIAWAREKEADAVVGVTGQPNACVLATYLHEQHPATYFHINAAGDELCADYSVFTDSLREDALTEGEPLPYEPNAIAVKFDQEFAYEHPVTAREFVEAFDGRFA